MTIRETARAIIDSPVIVEVRGPGVEETIMQIIDEHLGKCPALPPDWEPCSVGMAEHKRVVELLRVAEERMAAWERDIAHMEHEKNQQIAAANDRADAWQAQIESNTKFRERAEKAEAALVELQGEQRYASQRIAALTAENERLKAKLCFAEARANAAEREVKRLRAALEDVRVVAAVSCDDDMLKLLRQYLQIAKAALSAPGADGGKAPRV